MKTRTKTVLAELARLAAQSGGVLWPKKVVDAARPVNSPLHSKFDWNDSLAAEKYRIWQARQLIAVTVNVIGESAEAEQVWVSLKTDRADTGGYRSLIAVLSDKDLRGQLLQDAMEDMQVFENKYKHLQELADVFAAMRKTRKGRRAA
jgi:hypothetical protein